MNNHLKNMFLFIRDNQSKFLVLLLVVVTLDFLAKFPYFNVFLLFPYPLNSAIIIWVVTAIIFRLNERFSFATAFVLLLVIMISAVFGKSNLIEELGNEVYGLLLLGFVQMIARTILDRKA